MYYGIGLNMSSCYTPMMVCVVLCIWYACFPLALRWCISPSITKGLLQKLMNKKEIISLLKEQELIVLWLKNIINHICDPMKCLAFEYVYIKYVSDINAIV